MKKYFILQRYMSLRDILISKGYSAKLIALKGMELLQVEVGEEESYYISKLIFDSVRERIIEARVKKHIRDRLFRREYPMFDKILERTLSYMKDEHIKCKVIEDISEYIENNEITNIDGFIKFRLGYYSDVIEDSVEKALYDIELELEYRSIIKTIGYIGEIQKRYEKNIDIIFSGDGYMVLDSNGNRVENSDILEEVLEELGIDNPDNEEKIIGSIIDRAPEKIRIYREDDIEENTIDLIREMFGDRVELNGPYSSRLRLVGQNS